MSKEELVVEAPAEEEVVETPEEIEAKQKKAALAAFILGLVAWLLSGWFGGLVGIICGAIAIGKAKKAKGLEAKPGKIFRIVGLILGILGLVFGILTIIEMVILVCLGGLAALGVGVWAVIVYAVPAIQEAMAAGLALLAL